MARLWVILGVALAALLLNYLVLQREGFFAGPVSLVAFEGKIVKCTSSNVNKYYYTNGTVYQFPSADIARSWFPKYKSSDPVATIDCTKLNKGPNMVMRATPTTPFPKGITQTTTTTAPKTTTPTTLTTTMPKTTTPTTTATAPKTTTPTTTATVPKTTSTTAPKTTTATAPKTTTPTTVTAAKKTSTKTTKASSQKTGTSLSQQIGDLLSNVAQQAEYEDQIRTLVKDEVRSALRDVDLGPRDTTNVYLLDRNVSPTKASLSQPPVTDSLQQGLDFRTSPDVMYARGQENKPFDMNDYIRKDSIPCWACSPK
jgi:hypothetical protein